MAPGKPATVGTCPACDEPDQKLVTTRYLDDGKTAVCKKCCKKATNIAYREKAKGGQAGKPTPERKPRCPATAGPAPAAEPFHPPTPRGPFPTRLPAGRAVGLRFTCHEMADVRLLLEAGLGLSVAIGLEGVP
jgi:hypothetical protein